MAFERVLTDQNTWGFMNSRLKREPSDGSEANNSYTDLLWELNLVTSGTYLKGNNVGGSNNYYVGLITSVPYVNKGHGKNEDPSMRGPWYVTYCATDANEGSGKYAFNGHIDSAATAVNTYYADRIVLRQELDYALDKNYVNKYQLGTYYTGVGLWWDSWNTVNGGARTYVGKKEVPDGTYFTTNTYSEIFNDYTYNKATGSCAHAEGYHTYVVDSSYAHGEGNTTLITSSVNAHAEGLSTVIDHAHEAHVEGNSTKAFNGAYASHAEGTGSYTKGVNAHAENSAYANGKNSHAGGEATAGGNWSFAHGKSGTLASGTYSVALVGGTASGENSVAISGGQATSKNSIAIGEGAKANTGQDAIALNKGTSSGVDSFSANTGKSSSTRSAALNNSSASAADSFSANIGTASGTQSAALNASKAQSTNAFSANAGTASKDRATALNSSTALGTDSLAANTSTASGTNSASLNNGTASGSLSLASGHGTASGTGSHAEGESTNSKGTYSHAEGNHSVTEGGYAHAEGNWTKTTNDYEHAEGTFNQSYTGSDTQSASLFEIGDGTADNARHNVVSVLRNGAVLVDSKNNAYLAAVEDISINGNKTVHVTSPSVVTTTDTNHFHSNNYVCIRGNVSTYLKGSTTTYIGKDQEGNLSANTYVVGNKKTEYITGNLEETTTGTTTTNRNGAVTITNSSTVNETTNGKITETFTKGRSTTVSEGNSLAVNGIESERYNNERQSYVTGGTYDYVSEETNTYIGGNRYIGIAGKSTVKTIGNSICYVGSLAYKQDFLSYTRSTYLLGSHFVIGAAGQKVDGPTSLGLGAENEILGECNVALGIGNKIGKDTSCSTTIGKELRSYTSHGFVIGTYNKSYSSSYIEIGIGTDENHRKNALTISQYGVTYFHLQPYTYDAYINSVTYGSWDKDKNTYTKYSPTNYPDESCVVSQSYLKLSYDTLYKTTKTVIDNLASVDSMQSLDEITRSYTDNVLHYTSGHYDQTQEKYITSKHTIQQESATKELAGLMSGEDKVRSDDLEDRLNAVVKAASLPTFSLNTVTWKVYNNDKSKLLATYNNVTSITAEYGTYVTAENYTIKMNLNTNYDASFLATVTTKGPFGTEVPTFSPIANGSAVMSGSNSLASTYISPYTGGVKSKNVTTTSQTVRAVTQFGMKYLSTRKLANGNMQVYRLNDPDTYSEGNGFNISVNGKFGIIKWYGTTNTNPATFPSSMTQAALEAYMTGQYNAVSSNTKELTYRCKTDASHKYFFYVYRGALEKVSSVSCEGASATRWFNTTTQKTITITKTTTGMKEDYYLMYTMNENGLSKGDELTFS